MNFDLSQITGPLENMSGVTGLDSVLLSLLLSFVLGQIIAWAYQYTHSGLSYSRMFVHSLVMIPIIVCSIMVVIGSSLITAFGLLGALAIIRFRNVLKDTRDTTFIFMTLVIGIATGTGRAGLAILVTLFIIGACLYLYAVGFGGRDRPDAVLRLQLASQNGQAPIDAVLYRYCRKSILASERLAGTGAGRDLSYQLHLRDPARGNDLVGELQSLPDVRNVSLVRREEELEV